MFTVSLWNQDEYKLINVKSGSLSSPQGTSGKNILNPFFLYNNQELLGDKRERRSVGGPSYPQAVSVRGPSNCSLGIADTQTFYLTNQWNNLRLCTYAILLRVYKVLVHTE